MSLRINEIEQIMATYVESQGSVAVVAWDEKNTVIYCNKAFSGLMQSEAELCGKTIFELLRFPEFPGFNFGVLDGSLKTSACLKAGPTDYRCESVIFQLNKGYLAFCDRPVILQSDIVEKMARMNLELTNLTWESQKKNRTIERINEQLKREIAERQRTEEKLTASQAELAHDFELARRVQHGLLPELPVSPLVTIRTLYHPLHFVSGDAYYLAWHNQGSLLRGFLIDVSGHGLATAIQNTSINVLLREASASTLPLIEQLGQVNRRAEKYFTEGTYAAMLGFELDLSQGQLRYVGAGITQFYLNGRKIETPGMFVGLWAEAEFTTGEVAVQAGDVLYFLTDGFTDALAQQEKADFFSPDGMDFDADVAALGRLTHSGLLRDDATAVCLKIEAGL